MNFLILGGTVFLGRHLVEAALERGHQVTLFNRGQHNPDLFPNVEKLRGDRDPNVGDGLSALANRRWDVVIDTCGYFPRIVQASAELLADAVDRYVFISSISVYTDFSQPGLDESAPVGVLEDPAVEEITGETYGPLKALCEQAAEAAMPGRVLNIRPGLIVGPHDPTDRFTYWPVRVSRGGQVLCPSRPDYPEEVIDVRDLAEWTIRMAEEGKTGVYNATGPDYPLTLGEVVETSRSVSGSDATFVWVGSDFLLEQGVQPWMELPLWIGESPEYAGFARVNCNRAFADGLTFRPLAETIQDTLAWAASRPQDYTWRAGLTAEKEAELLRKWRERA